jgi:hypothetical protein
MATRQKEKALRGNGSEQCYLPVVIVMLRAVVGSYPALLKLSDSQEQIQTLNTQSLTINAQS